MIEASGHVIAVGERQVVVEVARKSSCDLCSARAICGQGPGCRVSDSAALHTHICARCNFPVSEGDTVVIGVSESAVLGASFRVYLLPLLFLVVAIGFGHWSGLTEACLIISGLLAMGVGLGIAARLFRNENRQRQLQPVVLSWQSRNL